MIQHNSLHKLLIYGIILLFITTGFSSVISAQKNMNTFKSTSVVQLPSKAMNNSEIKDAINNLIRLLHLKHPILLRLVQKLNIFRYNIFVYIRDHSGLKWFHHTIIGVDRPIIFLLSLALDMNLVLHVYFWLTISNLLGWGWTLEDIEGF